MMKKNRKKIYLCPKDSLPPIESPPATDGQQSEPTGPPATMVDPVPEPAAPTSIMSPRSPRTSSTVQRGGKYLKAPRAVYKGHRLAVTCVGILQSPLRERSIIFSGSDDKNVIAWSLETGEKIAELKGHTQRVTSIATFSAPGYDPLVISAGWDERVRIWQVKECFPSIPSDEGPSKSAESTPGVSEVPNDARKPLSERLAEKAIVLRGHKNRIFGVAVLHPVGEEPAVASGSSDNTIRVWSLPAGELMYVLEDEYDDTWNLCLSAWFIPEQYAAEAKCHGNVVIAGCKNNTVRVWQHRSPAVLKEFREREAELRANAAAQGARSLQQFLTHRRRERTEPNLVIRGHKSAVHSVAPFDHQGRPFVVTACKDSDVRIFSLLSGALIKTLKGHTSGISTVTAFRPSAGYASAVIVSCSKEDAHMRVWQYATGECLRFFKGHSAEITSVLMHAIPSAPLVTGSTSTDDGDLGLTKLYNSEAIAQASVTKDDLDLVIVTASRDATVRSWLFAEEKALRILETGDGVKIKAMDVYTATDPAESIVVTGADDGALRAWHTQRDEPTSLATVTAVAASSGGAAVEANPGLVWETEPAQKIPILAVAVYVPYVTSHDSDTARVVTAHWPKYLFRALVVCVSRNGTVRLCSLSSGQEVCPPLLAHNKAITSVCVFPGHAGNVLTKSIDPFIVTGSEDHSARLWSLVDCTCLRTLNRHIFDVTSVAVYLPPLSTRSGVSETRRFRYGHRGAAFNPLTAMTGVNGHDHSGDSSDSVGSVVSVIDPIIITGGMDDTIRLWKHSTGENIEVLTDVKCHVTCLTHFTVPASENAKYSGPVLIAGDGDGVVWLWALRTPYELLATLPGHADEVRSVHAYVAEGNPPVLVSASLDCTVKVWNLESWSLLKTIEGHTADVTAVRVFPLGGGDLALVSASSDATTRVVYEFLETAPQYDVVVQLFEFDLNGTNTHVVFDTDSAFPRIAQLARKEGEEQFFGTYHFLFGEALRRGRPDFLEEFLHKSYLGLLKSNQPDNSATIKGANGKTSAKPTTTPTAKPKADTTGETLSPSPSHAKPTAVSSLGSASAEDKDSQHSGTGKLLPHTRSLAGLPKNLASLNIPGGVAVKEVGGMLQSTLRRRGRDHGYGADDPVSPSQGSLLHQALERRDTRAVRCIVDCWCRFFTENRSDLIYDESFGRLSMPDMILLSEVAAVDFQKLICTIPLVPTKNNTIPPGTYYLYENEIEKSVTLGMTPKADNTISRKARNSNEQLDTTAKRFMFLPLTNAVHMDMLHAYTKVCEELDSVEIFNSEVGKLALAYAWRRIGLLVHLKKMWIYFFYIFVSTASLLSFDYLASVERYEGIALALVVVQLALNGYFVKEEWQQFAVDPVEYMSDVWNCLDLCVIVTNTAANVVRLLYFNDTIASEVLLCLSSIVGYFNILYFLRAFEATGPLVSMILRISHDIRYLLFVVVIVSVGFAQAFWMICRRDSALPFSTFEGSMLYSFVFLLGGFDPTAFEGVPLYRLAIALSSIYMIIVSVLLLNLLIALMGDSYGSVKEKGLAQWKLEQAQIITEMQGGMKDEKRACTAVIYFRKNADGTNNRDSDRMAQLEATVRELRQEQQVVLRMLREQSEMNNMMREFISRAQR